MSWRAVLVSWLLLLLFASGTVASPPEALTGPVVDRTGTLAAAEVSNLSAMVGDVAARKGSQIAVLVVETTAPLTIEQYALETAEATRLGRAGVDDGVLILVATDDRQARIEVGYGLEGVIPDATASRIIREYMGPRFREGDYNGGLVQAVTEIGRLIDGESLPEPYDEPVGADWIPEVLFGAVLGATVAGLVVGLPFGRAGRVISAAAGGALLAAVMLKVLLSVVSAAMVAALFALTSDTGRWAITGRGRRSGAGSWSGGGASSSRAGGSWSTGGSSSSGWSGGGGGFGGGGASGRW